MWPQAGPSRRCSRYAAEMSNQFVTTGEHDDTRRWACPNCDNQEMRSRLNETVNITEEVNAVIGRPGDQSQQQQQQ
ncbi:MAG: hypothetical protein M3270_08285 [Thermoproteota archaeon]|nr:hypothetical protein [Thermoproteota archaeon]